MSNASDEKMLGRPNAALSLHLFYKVCLRRGRVSGQEALDGNELAGDGRRRERLEEAAAVPLGSEARIEDGQDAPVLPVSDQAPESLEERQDGHRNLVLAERIAASAGDRFPCVPR